MKEFENNNPEIREELQKLGSLLGQQKPPGGFKVPEDYFARLPNAVQDKILQQKVHKQAVLNVGLAKRLWPVLASVALLLGLTFSLFLIQRNGVSDYLASDDALYEMEYLINYHEFGQDIVYDAIMESDLTAQDILYDLDHDTFDDPDAYDELMEQMFEKSNYYGIESSYLLSYLD